MRVVGAAFKGAKNAPLVKPIYLYTISIDPTSNTFKRYTSWPGGVTFDGFQYDFFAITHSSISENSSGKIQSSSISMANITREVQAIIDANDGLRGREVTITQVWADRLSEPTAFISDIFRIQEVIVTEQLAEFSLASSLDVMSIRVPRRVLTRSFCRFRFKGEECAYAGDQLLCDKTLNRCRALGNARRFGGFPAIPQQQTFLTGNK